jgi:uncharacterized protein YaiL (DUF2058 family)
MAESLQDQLKALGLAKEKKPARKKKAPRRTNRGQSSAATPDSGDGGMSLGKAWALREKQEKQSAQQKRARKIEEDRKRRELNKAIREIVKPNRQNSDDAEVARNFMFRERIRKVYVTPEQNKALGSGEMGLVYLSGGYHVLAAEHVEAVQKIAADHVVDLSAGDDPSEEENPVPDDLIW